jgi:Major tropism determinant N-terminal domain
VVVEAWRHQNRGRTAAQFTAENPTLAAREFGVETDTLKVKVADGVTAWNGLDYIGELYTDAAIAALPELASSDPAKMSVSTAGGVTTLGVEKLAPEFARLTANSAAVNNSITLVDITGLLVPVAASAVYIVNACIFYTTTTIARYKLGWTIPAGATGRWHPLIIGATQGSPGTILVSAQDWTGSRSGGGTGTILGMQVIGLLVTSTTAGNLQAQHAQDVAEATNTTAAAHTWLRAERVA